MEINDKDRALKYWEKMRDFQPNHSLVYLSKAYLETPEAALDLLLKNQAAGQDLLATYNALGRHFTIQGEFSKALEYYAKVGDYEEIFDEMNFERYANQGLALWKSGRKTQGKQLMEKALDGYLNHYPQRTFFSDREIRLAAIYAFLDNKSAAYEWLNKSSWEKAAHFDIQQDVWFSNISQETKFRKLVDQSTLDKKKIRNEIARLKSTGDWEI
jgi:tetratricopeptide (TPR) repeat protein